MNNTLIIAIIVIVICILISISFSIYFVTSSNKKEYVVTLYKEPDYKGDTHGLSYNNKYSNLYGGILKNYKSARIKSGYKLELIQDLGYKTDQNGNKYLDMKNIATYTSDKSELPTYDIISIGKTTS
jgi:hypothetical protein